MSFWDRFWAGITTQDEERAAYDRAVRRAKRIEAINTGKVRPIRIRSAEANMGFLRSRSDQERSSQSDIT